MIKIGTMFSGIDAPVQALKQTGIDHEFSFCCEKNAYALRSIESNYDPIHIFEDVTKIAPIAYPKVDLFVVGYPCQDISMLTQRSPYEGTQSKLVVHSLDYIEVRKPRIVVLENVANVNSGKNKQFFDAILSRLLNMQYKVTWFKINASDLGAPQHRKRLWMVASINESVVQKMRNANSLPIKKEQDTLIYDIIEPKVDDRYYVSETVCDKLAKTIKNKYRGIVAGTKKLGVFSPRTDGKATCLDAHYHITMDNHGQRTFLGEFGEKIAFRKLTPRECLRLQDFPDSFNIVVPDEEAYRQAGNTMNLRCLQYIYANILE